MGDSQKTGTKNTSLDMPIILMWLGLILPFCWLIGLILGIMRVARGAGGVRLAGHAVGTLVVGFIIGMMIFA